MRGCGTIWLVATVLGLHACGGPPDEGKAIDCGPVVARVGGARLCAMDVEPLAEQAAKLRGELGLEVADASRLDLAVEFLTLLQLGPVAEGKKRLLARTYLDRVFGEEKTSPVTDAEIEQAHRDEIKNYLATAQSDIYRPTRIDATAIVVGCFPDLHPPEDDEVPVLNMAQARELAAEIYAACGERVADLDDFLSIARRFMRGNPTVQVEEYPRVAEDFRLARTPPPLHQTITRLPDNGAVAAPLERPGAVFIVRRGFTYPGRGEKPAEIRAELSARVRHSRSQAAYRERLEQLLERYRVRTWPERLRGSE